MTPKVEYLNCNFDKKKINAKYLNWVMSIQYLTVWYFYPKKKTI